LSVNLREYSFSITESAAGQRQVGIGAEGRLGKGSSKASHFLRPHCLRTRYPTESAGDARLPDQETQGRVRMCVAYKVALHMLITMQRLEQTPGAHSDTLVCDGVRAYPAQRAR